MTAREALVALRGLETTLSKTLPDLLHKLTTVAHEIVRIESSMTERQHALAATTVELQAVQATVAELKATAQGLTRQIAAEREAARHAWEAEADERAAALGAALATQRASAEQAWAALAAEAKAAHAEKLAHMQAVEKTLADRVSALRAHAEQMLRSAEAVLR